MCYSQNQSQGKSKSVTIMDDCVVSIKLFIGMLGFTLVPEPNENRRIRELVTRTNYSWISGKEPNQQQGLALRQLTTLFSNSLSKLTKELKPVLEDLDIQQARPTNEEVTTPGNGTIGRSSLFKQAADKLIRSQLLRNQEVKRSVEDYSREYEERHQDSSTILVEHDRQDIGAETATSFQPRYSMRPRTTPVNQRFSRSLIIERKDKSREDRMRATTGGLSMGLSMTTNINTPMFQCRGFTPSGKVRNNPTQNSLSVSKHLDMCNSQQINVRLSNPQQPLLHLQQPDLPRVSFIDENRRQFAPAFGQRRHSAFSTTNTAYSKATQVEILKDKIRLLNCQFAIKVTRQQGYKKKQRNLRNLSSILV